MRLTIHIKKYTVTIIVKETSKKAKAQHGKKSNRHSPQVTVVFVAFAT